MSGHIFFADTYFGFDDALYAAVRLIDLVARGDKSIGDMRDALPQMVNTPEIRIDVAEERKSAVVDAVKQSLLAAGAEVNDIDGVRVSRDGGWWLLRASNTQSALVVRCEAQGEDALEDLKAEVIAELNKAGLAVDRLEPSAGH